MSAASPSRTNWTDVLNPNVAVPESILNSSHESSSPLGITHERTASAWTANRVQGRGDARQSMFKRGHHGGNSGGVVGGDSGAPPNTASSSAIDIIYHLQAKNDPSVALVHQLARREAPPMKGYLGEMKMAHKPTSLSSTTSTQSPQSHQSQSLTHSLDDSDLITFASTPVHAGAIFPVRPNTVLLEHKSDATKATEDEKNVDEGGTMEERIDGELLELLRQPARTISSYLYKQGKTRKKWSRRYFTLLPAKFQLIYSHKKEQGQGVTFEEQQLDGKEDDDDDDGYYMNAAKPLSSPHSDDASSNRSVVVISLKRFRFETSSDSNSNSKHYQPLHLTLILPDSIDGQLDDGRGVGMTKERRIELKADSQEIYDTWTMELRRLQHYISYLLNYMRIVSRNKVYTMQGRRKLIQDPNPAHLDVPESHLTLMMHGVTAAAVANTAAGSTTKTLKSHSSPLAVLSSLITGHSSPPARCSKCQSKFGLLTSVVVCTDCHQRFCKRSTCMVPYSYLEENMDVFDMMGNVSRGKDGRRHRPSTPRICHSCHTMRHRDPIYTHLLNGQLNLCIRILSGANLMAANLLTNTSDPYVKFTVGKQEYRTSCIEGTCHPQWYRHGQTNNGGEAEFNIPWNDTEGGGSNEMSSNPLTSIADSSNSSLLCLEVWDRDRLSTDNFLGCVYLNVNDLEKNVLYSDHFPIRSKRETDEKETLASGSNGNSGATSGATNEKDKSDKDSKENGTSNTSSTATTSSFLLGKKKPTGTLHIQIILTTASYTAELLHILPTVQELRQRPNQNHSSIISPKGPLVSSPSSSSSSPSTSLPSTINPLELLKRSRSRYFSSAKLLDTTNATATTTTTPNVTALSPIPSSPSTPSAPPALATPTSSNSPFSFEPSAPSQLQIAITSLLQSSHLHSLLLRALQLHSSLRLDDWHDMVHDILTYQNPFMSIVCFLVCCILLYTIPSWCILPFLPFILLLHLVSNLMSVELAAGELDIARMEKAALAKEAEEVAQAQYVAKQARKMSSVGMQLKQHLGGWFKSSKKNDTATSSSPASTLPAQSSSRAMLPSTSTSTSAGSVPDIASPLSSTRSVQSNPSHSTFDFNNTASTPTLTSQPNSSSELPPLATPRLTSSSPSSLPPASHLSPTPLDIDDSPQSDDGLSVTSPFSPSRLDHDTSVVLRIRRLKRQVRTVQELIDRTMDSMIELEKLFTWRDIDKSRTFARMCAIIFAMTMCQSN